MDIGKRLKQLREKNNKTLKQVYEDTGISISNSLHMSLKSDIVM